MTDYKKCGYEIMPNGKKRVLYSKKDSTKKYVVHKGRMMNVVNYKKMLKNQANREIHSSRKGGMWHDHGPHFLSLNEKDMIKLFANDIRSNRRTIDLVPEHLRDRVKKELSKAPQSKFLDLTEFHKINEKLAENDRYAHTYGD